METVDDTNGMDFRVGFMKLLYVVKPVPSRYEVESGLYRQAGWYRGFNIIRPITFILRIGRMMFFYDSSS